MKPKRWDWGDAGVGALLAGFIVVGAGYIAVILLLLALILGG